MVLLVHVLARLATLLGTRGTKAVVAENLILKHQLLVIQRSRRRAPNRRPADRVLLGFLSRFLDPRRLVRAAVIVKPATLLRFHRGLRDLKYRFLYSSHSQRQPGPKGPPRKVKKLEPGDPQGFAGWAKGWAKGCPRT